MSEKNNLKKRLPYDETFQCVQCGYCLPVCPTYKTMARETHSPRGRINLIKMAAEGKISFSKLEEPIDLCLGCRACETACPTGVKYGKILEMTKEILQLEKNKRYSPFKKALRNFLFQHGLPNKRLMNFAADILWIYEKIGLKDYVHRSSLCRIMPDSLLVFDKIVQIDTNPIQRRKRKNVFKPHLETPPFKIAFFTGCIMDVLFNKINYLSIKLLQACGCEVIIVDNQTCCGALHAHNGELECAKMLAKANIQAFERYNVHYIVNSAGGCGGMLVEYGNLLKDEPDWAERARRFSEKNKDISWILSRLKLPIKKEIQHTATYQRSCHMTNVQHITTEPVELLTSIPGLTLKEMQQPDMCCGSAGTYNLIHYDESMKILADKMQNIKETNADLVVTTNPGCLIQMKLGIERETIGKKIKVVHLVELLADACKLNE
jgi:glycolate oxidase iron-sulfur subunit